MDLEEIKQKYPPYNKALSKKCIDMSGEKIGRLTVLYRYYQNANGGQARWVCQCDCGNICIPRGAALRNKTSTSCGCLTYENASKANVHNLIGKKFGKLTVIEDTKKRNNHRVIWLCKCDCGNYVERLSDSLIQEDTISCGCCNQSKGSLIIEKLLKNNNISYQKEKIFNDLRGKNNMPYRYDFYLPEYNRLIEFDGIQHFKERSVFKDSLEEIKTRDIIKNNYALENCIDLVRIPYWKEDSLKIEDLLENKYLIER